MYRSVFSDSSEILTRLFYLPVQKESNSDDLDDEPSEKVIVKE